MKSVTNRSLFKLCIIYFAILLNPPWINAYTQEFLGFHFILANDLTANQFAKVDFARLLIVVGAASILAVAIHLALRSNAFENFLKSISSAPGGTDDERRRKERNQDMYFRIIGIAGVISSIAFIIYASTT